MKLIFCAIFATLFLQVLAGSHDVEWGEKGPRDYLLFREIYTKKYSFLRVVSEDVSITTKGVISYIKATDQYIKNGGYVTIIDGGLTFDNVKFHFKSQRNHGYNFIVEVWGH